MFCLRKQDKHHDLRTSPILTNHDIHDLKQAVGLGALRGF